MKITVSTDGVLERVTTGLEKLSTREAQRVMSMALNREGNKGRTDVRRATARVMGTGYGTVVKATKTKPSKPGNLTYELTAEGDFTSLKEYRARQTRPGVTAAPWGTRRTFEGSFGPNISKLGGHVFVRQGEQRFPIRKLWGPAIPREVMRNEPADHWRAILPRLDREILREIDRLLTVARVSRHLQQAIAR